MRSFRSDVAELGMFFGFGGCARNLSQNCLLYAFFFALIERSESARSPLSGWGRKPKSLFLLLYFSIFQRRKNAKKSEF